MLVRTAERPQSCPWVCLCPGSQAWQINPQKVSPQVIRSTCKLGYLRKALEAAGGGGREPAFGESLTAVALGAERDLSVDDR